jgi:hypothetical protein
MVLYGNLGAITAIFGGTCYSNLKTKTGSVVKVTNGPHYPPGQIRNPIFLGHNSIATEFRKI